MKNRITIEQAERKMFGLLQTEDMGDRVYELAQDLYQKYIQYIEEHFEITGKEEYLDSDQEWYDSIYEEFFQAVYDAMVKFLTAKQ